MDLAVEGEAYTTEQVSIGVSENRGVPFLFLGVPVKGIPFIGAKKRVPLVWEIP